MPLLLELPWPCSEEALARVFVRASSTLRLIFLFSYVFSVLLPKIYPLFVSSGSEDYYEYEQQDELVYEEVEDTAGVDYVEEEEVVANEFGYDYNNTSYYYDYNDSTSRLDTRRDGDELVVDDGGETLMFLSSRSSNIESSFDHETEDVSEEEDVQKSENNGDEDVEKREESENNGDEEVKNREEIEKYSEEEEEEEDVVIVEDITGREDSYLDDMEVFDVDQGFNESNYVDEVRELEDPSSSTVNNNDILHYYNQDDDHQQQRGKVVWEIEPATEPPIIRSTEEQKKNTETFTANNTNYDINSTTDHHFTINDHHHHPRVVKQEEEQEEEVMFSDSGSTSKSSSEWRSSLFTCKDSATTDEPFSSSSRRSCRKWESYTIFQKYDEEMLFLDRISARKLQETESLKALQSTQPRSISRKIVHHLTSAMTARAKTHTAQRRRWRHNSNNNNPYYELEAAYVAQVCLAWEALSWNYDNFKRKQNWIKKQGGGSDPGCPDMIAQQFQQFQVLLQRYIENEPYEYGRRPEIYARMRIVFPKLMQVPEYHDYDDEQKDKQEVQRIPTVTFVAILEDSILTFMNFVKTDTTNRYRLMFSALFRSGHSSNSDSIDPIQLDVMKKINKKKKLKLEEVRRRSRRSFWACCAVNERKITREEEMEVVMGLIDLKVVTRVLRMGGHNILTQEQLKWCEAKMAKITFSATTGRVHRDSTPLFFPAH